MLKFILTLALFLEIFEASSQSTLVKSFRWLEPRQVTGMPSTKPVLNGQNCAIIKVETAQSRFIFDFGLIGNAVATVQNEGAIWLWVPAGAQKVTISNKKSGVLCVYPFGRELEEEEVYAMVLKVDNARVAGKIEVATKWVTLHSRPEEGAVLYIDDFHAGETPYHGSLTIGTHNVKMEINNEKKEETITISKDIECTFGINFKPRIYPEGCFDCGGMEESPEYKGGYEAMLKFLHDNIQYPALAQEKGIQGTVFVQLILSETGKISNVKTLRGIGGGCDEEAVRVVRMMPKWNAGRFHVAIPVMFQIPVKFKLPVKPQLPKTE